MKSRISIIIICLGLIVSINGCGFMGKRYMKMQSEQHQISTAGKNKVKLENMTGNLKISHSPDSGSLIINASKEVKVKKKYIDTPFDEISIRIDSGGSTISIITEINRDGSDHIFTLGKDLNFNGRVDYEISIPSNLDIEIDNINGNISTNNLSNDITIDLVNGEVDLENYTGMLRCEITNGSFSAEIDSTRGMDVSTINGNVTLNLNNFMNANLRAETMNGKITDDNLEFRLIDKEKRLFKGKLGSGETDVDIKIETVNGRIKLLGRNEI